VVVSGTVDNSVLTMNECDGASELEDKESVCEGIRRWINSNIMQIGQGMQKYPDDVIRDSG